MESVLQGPADCNRLVVPHKVVVLLCEGIQLSKDQGLEAVDRGLPLQLPEEISCSQPEFGVVRSRFGSLTISRATEMKTDLASGVSRGNGENKPHLGKMSRVF